MTTTKAMQPIGFWTARAAEAVRTRTRGALDAIGMTQPEWWILHQLSLHPVGLDRAAIIDIVGPNESSSAIETALDGLIAKGAVYETNSKLTCSTAGTREFVRAAEIQNLLQAERMQGISSAEFDVTITVLQRTIVNVGGDARHW